MKRALIFVILSVGFASVAEAQTCTGSPEQIVSCEREKAGGAVGLANPANIVTFLKATASSLNTAGIPGGPFGILLKPGGHNCNGYSCDVLCAGNGPGQRQWDVLGDAGGQSIPTWSPIENPAVRVCEPVSVAPTPTPVPQPQPPAVDLSPILARLDALEKEHAVLKAEDARLREIIAAIPPVVFPVYKGSIFGIGIVSRPCPSCK